MSEHSYRSPWNECKAPFQPCPSELVFQNFTPGQTQNLSLVLFNNDKVSRQVKLEQQESEFFCVVSPEDTRQKVAPGLSATFTVLFTPQENKDHHHKLVFVTEREKFEIPIHAIGPRAILDFHHELHLPACPVKASSQRNQLVRNIGNSPSMFKLHTQRPFSVTPSSGTLDVGESMQVTVYFNPLTSGDHKQELVLHYHTGEVVYIGLYGTCEELNVNFESDVVLLKKTYITLNNTHTVSLTNNSDIPLQYYWTTWSNKQEEDLCLLSDDLVIQQKEKEQLIFQSQSDNTEIHCVPLLSRAIQECRRQTAKDSLLNLSHSCISIEPVAGEIWPNTAAEFTIVFKPEEAKLYEETIFCDITGHESRLPLTIKGEGLGPKLQANFDLMDMKNVFIWDTDNYEVLLSNSGLIDAPFRLSSPDTAFGRCFSFCPEDGVVPPGACQFIKITFHSCILGTFSEELRVTISGEPKQLTLTFRGCVIAPTFHFNVPELNFGDVAFGFPQKSICTLFNTSFVPMTFALRVLGDGTGAPSVSSARQVSELCRNNWQGSAAKDLHERPMEFTVSPASGSVRAMSDINIMVTLCSNTVRAYSMALVVDVEGVGEEIKTLPINARCVVPEIVVETPVLDLQRCFIDYPYEQNVRLINTNPLPACFGMLEQENEENPALTFYSSKPRGLIFAQSTAELPVRLLAKAVGKLRQTLRIAVFGSIHPPLEVILSCNGHGPNVQIQSGQLDFGRIPVLTDTTRTLLMSNKTPIPARFTAHMSQERSLWHVEPMEGEVPAKGQLELRVVAHLKDTLFFQDKLKVSIQDGERYTVSLYATGTGTTIVSDKPLSPCLDLGTHFSHELCQYHFKLTNLGQRTHRLYWRTDGSLTSTKIRKGENSQSQIFINPIPPVKNKDVVTCGSPVSSTTVRPVFSISPTRVELFPGTSIDMVLEGSSDSPKVVRERLLCIGIVGRQSSYEHIMSVDVSCCFVAPILQISPKQLKFYMEKVPGQSLVSLYEKLVLRNVSSVPLSLELSLVAPFSLCEAQGNPSNATNKCMFLDNGTQAELWICFDPTFCQDKVSQVMDEILEVHYHRHPQQDVVNLHAEVHFPNLHFSSTTVDFGCVLNGSETRRELTITNCSPLLVFYRWTCLVNKTHCAVSKQELANYLTSAVENEDGSDSSGAPAIPDSTFVSHKPCAHEPLTQCSMCVEECSTNEVDAFVISHRLFQGQDNVNQIMTCSHVFDVLPSYGHLLPGEQQLVAFFFYGHHYVSKEVIAQCQVEEGPTYDIILRGEASEVSYVLDSTVVDFGLQHFDQVGEAYLTLRNTGKVGFKFKIYPPQKEQEDEKEADAMTIRLGQPTAIPNSGYVDAGMEQCLHVIFLPGIPEVFERSLQLVVAHLPPQEITVIGEGVFPRISLNLSRNLSEECYRDVVQQARANVEVYKTRFDNESITSRRSATETISTFTDEETLHMEIDRILVKEDALAVTENLAVLTDLQGSYRKCLRLTKLLLPEYILDFGYVILGKAVGHTLNVTNTGSVAVSFHANCKVLVGTGFSLEFERVNNLPSGETQNLPVKFNPHGAKLDEGEIQVVLPIQVTGGPVVQLRLCASVAVPAVTVSTDSLQFDTVQCGMCQMKMIQLLNHESVPCNWRIAEEVKPCIKVDKFLPLYKRKKALQQQQPPPVVFEVVPSSGWLFPSERINVQIKFSPTAGCSYIRKLVVSVAESHQQLFITAQGQGEEPQLEFSLSELDLGPCLPFSTDAETEVTIKNPCSFPIELYSLDFDTQYLEEEKILCLMPGYDKNNMLLLPPRTPGESLPTELVDYYKDCCSQMTDQDLTEVLDERDHGVGETPEEVKTPKKNKVHPPDSKDEKLSSTVDRAVLILSEMTEMKSSVRLRDLDMTPVTRAIARHMGVDLSPEGLAARNCRGIAIIVYGAPQTGKSSIAAALARHYGGVCLRIDAVLTDVLINGTSPLSLKAKQLCERAAAAEYSQKMAEEAAQTFENITASGPEHAEAPDSPLNSPLRGDGMSNTGTDIGNNSKALKDKEHTKIAKRLGLNMTTISTLLPEQLMVNILAERLQSSDCRRGVIIDGLGSLYTQTAAGTLQVILKALNNRKYIYVVNLSDTYPCLKARERAQREAEEALKREKADREEQWLNDMDEDEYNALPEEERERIVKRHREQKLRELERLKRRQEEKKYQEDMKRLKEEEQKRKTKKFGKKDPKEISKKKTSLEGKQHPEIKGQKDERMEKSKKDGEIHTDDQPMKKDMTREKQPAAVGGRMSASNIAMDTNDQRNLREGHQNKELDSSIKKTDETLGDQLAESHLHADDLKREMGRMDELQCQFIAYEQSQTQVDHILHHWDRVQGLLLVSLPHEEAPLGSEDHPPGKKTPVGKRIKKASTKVLSPMPSQVVPHADIEKVVDVIPQIILKRTGKDHPSLVELLKSSILPPLEEVLDELGLGPNSPPIPPPIILSVAPYPRHRDQSYDQLTCDCFTFLSLSGPDDQSDEKKDSDEDVQSSVTKEDVCKSRSKSSIKEVVLPKDKDKKVRESQRGKRRTSAKTRGKGSDQPRLPQNLELKRKQSLKTFRWVIPAHGEVVLKIWFYSETPGKFEQIFNFELLGTQRQYQLHCRGICTYPSICKDYKTLFAFSKKVPQMTEGLQKTYVVKPGIYEFGPLLCSKTRDRYKENKYPENTERLVIKNNSSLEAEVNFRFQHDTQASTYLLDPPTMILKPDQKQDLTIWAYPTKLGEIKDSIVCCIKDNPELVTMHLSCTGVRPELELERKHLHFERVLLHRWDSRSVRLHNKTALPVSWKMQGVEDLGDEFSVPQDQGIISPNSILPLTLHFRAKKPVHIKKFFRLEISDAEKILGIVHTENIQVTAEAYDIALDITPEGCLDFGIIKVFDEAELFLKMKNQGKYEIAYKFKIGQTEAPQPKLESIFTVSPESGTLLPHKKPTTVQILCKPKKEFLISVQPILSCQVIEPSIGEGGETIGLININGSVQSVFTRYMITPICDINFGPLVYGCKKSQTFTIENTGVFESRFTISCMSNETLPPAKPGGPSKKIPRELQSGKLSSLSSKVRGESSQKDSTGFQNRLTLGVFSVSPCAGTLQPACQQVVTVDCVAEQLGNWNQGLLIDINGRDPSDHPEGIPYKLLAEVCKPSIDLDMPSIFEEHYLCDNSSQLSSEQFSIAEGIYVMDENKFIFNKVLVGRSAQARFKLTNSSKVPCSLGLTIKGVGMKMSGNVEGFELSAATLSIPSQSHAFAVVSFTPLAMQLYSAIFEVNWEGVSRMSAVSKNKVLDFDLVGEGFLPCVHVVHPAQRDSGGIPLLQFKRVLVGRRRCLPLVLLNDGNVPAQVQIDLFDEDRVFTIKAAHGNTCSPIHCSQYEDTSGSGCHLVHRTTLRLNVNEQVQFEVSFSSDRILSVKTKMSLLVEDNQYNSIVIPVSGEAYQELITLEKISKALQEADQESNENGNYQLLHFGDCHVDLPYQESFTMTNHSKSQVMKFEWPTAVPHLVFAPQMGHLHAGCSKEISVTFCSNQPVTLTNQPMRCKICQVEFHQPLEEVADWDDQQKTVQWLSTSRPASGGQAQQVVRNKMIKTDPEPNCSVVEGSQLELELRISAVCDFVTFSCDTKTIQFADTLLYQKELHHVQIVNQGSVQVDFSWQVLMNPSTDVNQYLEDWALTSELGCRPAEAVTGECPATMMGNPELPPFTVEPKIGVILPGVTQNFSICFSPLKVAQFQAKLLCSIPNLQDGDEVPCMPVSGRSLLPHCHFDLEDSDYISGSRRKPEFRGLLDPNIRVIEFCAVGLSAPTRRCFGVMNPTSRIYSFKWRCEDSGDSPFSCRTQGGIILPGKKEQMCFEYVAKHMDEVESFWSLLIENLSLSFPFLCVGAAREPMVYLDKPHFDLGDQLIGCGVTRIVNLVNGEQEPFHFSVLQTSLLCSDQHSSLTLQPMTGTVASKDRLPLSVSFTPCQEGFVSFKLMVKIKRKPQPLTLTIKADCFTMSASVQVENLDGGIREINPYHPDTLDFGKVGIAEFATFHILVSNMARVTLQVDFNLTGPSDLLQNLETKPGEACIDVGKQLQSSIIFTPCKICNLQDVRLSIKVKNGATFNFAIKGRAVAPNLEFSFAKHNFGKCVLHSPGMVPASQTLVLCNQGKRDMSIQSPYQNTSFLKMDFRADVLFPGAVMEVPIIFYPRELRRYHEKLPFIINSCLTRQVEIFGQGVELKLEVEDPKQRRLKLGTLLLGQRVKKEVILVNHSLVDLSFTLHLNTDIPLDSKDLSVSPAMELNLKANGGASSVDVIFSPHQHLPPFTAELQAQYLGFLHPLLTVQGSCQGVEVQLDRNHLAFGGVVQHSQAKKKIIMMNSGNIGAKFKWKTENFPRTLSITPAKGYISPGKEVPFMVTFSPVALSNDTRYENLSCWIENATSPLMLTVTGTCVDATTGKELVNFVCPVRGSHTQTLPMINPTNLSCNIQPVIEGRFWRGALSMRLEPFQSKTYEITYRPLTMTSYGKKHLGSLFFSFPDGSGMLYYLQGIAEPPKAENTIAQELPAKSLHTELLPVTNWLSVQQRFRVMIEILKPDKPDATLSLKGPEYIDVPALSKADYHMSFFTYKEGQYNTKVTFRNEVSGEYLFYLVNFKTTAAGVLSTMELVTVVRQKTSATVQVENPLTTPVCLLTDCKCPDISAPTQHTIPGQSKGALSFDYQPLRAGESTARLTLYNNDLGFFHYNLLLKALPALPEKTVHFSTSLGSSQTVLAKFTNHSRLKTEYSCKIDCLDFIVEKSVSASPGFQAGSQVNVEVCFEPHQLGEVKGQLCLSSGIWGEYIFPLQGTCFPPKAQGPFSIRAGRNIIIPFKNVFLETTAFSYQVDSPLFTIKGVESILSKKTQNIQVSFEVPPEDGPGPWLGRLTISSKPSGGNTSPASWVYYLRGFRPEAA